MTPEKLFDYADSYARCAEAADKGTQYPTFRQVAKRFRVNYDEIEAVAGAGVDDGYLGVASGVGISGVGYAAIKSRGDWMVEAYR